MFLGQAHSRALSSSRARATKPKRAEADALADLFAPLSLASPPPRMT